MVEQLYVEIDDCFPGNTLLEKLWSRQPDGCHTGFLYLGLIIGPFDFEKGRLTCSVKIVAH